MTDELLNTMRSSLFSGLLEGAGIFLKYAWPYLLLFLVIAIVGFIFKRVLNKK